MEGGVGFRNVESFCDAFSANIGGILEPKTLYSRIFLTLNIAKDFI